MSLKDNLYKTMKETAIKRLATLPESTLAEEAARLQFNVDTAIQEARRTIRPVRLLLSIDAFILLEAVNALEHHPTNEHRPKYKGLTCHPSVFPNTDINPFQFFVLG